MLLITGTDCCIKHAKVNVSSVIAPPLLLLLLEIITGDPDVPYKYYSLL